MPAPLTDSQRRGQVSPEHQCIYSIRVIARQSFHDAIAVTLIERQRGDVVDRSIEPDLWSSDGLQALFCGTQKPGAGARPSGACEYNHGNDVTPISRVSNDETNDF